MTEPSGLPADASGLPSDASGLPSDASGLLAERLSDSWRAALGRPPATPDADFFAAGGDSLLIVRTVALLRQSGVAAGPADFLRGRTFAGVLARLRASNPRPVCRQDGHPPAAGPVPLLPSQLRWIGAGFADPDHFARECVFQVPETTPDGRVVDTGRIEAAVRALTDRHEALRTSYLVAGAGRPVAEVLEQAPGEPFESVQTDDDGVPDVLRRGMAGHRLAAGRVLTASWLPRQRLLQVAVHNLTVDGYSITVLADHLEDLLIGREPGRPACQPRHYAADLARWSTSAQAAEDSVRWAALGWADVARIPTDTSGPGLLPSMASESAGLDAEQTGTLRHAARDLGRSVDLLVLAAAGRVITEHFGVPAVSVDTYHHGRGGLAGGHDLTETVGYLQSTYPVVVHAGPRRPWLSQVATDLAGLPACRFGFDTLRFAGHAGLAGLTGSGVRLVFRSRMNELNARPGRWLRPAEVSGGDGRRSPRQREPHLLVLFGDLVNGRLVFTVKYSRDHFTTGTAGLLAAGTAALLATAGRPARPTVGGHGND